MIRLIVKNIAAMFFLTARNILNPILQFSEVSVLCYHSVEEAVWKLSIHPKKFEKQILFFKKRRYYFAALDEIVDYVKGKQGLPNKTIAITFDDGYKSVYTNAFPILKKYNIPATIFIMGDFTGSAKNRGISINGLSGREIDEMEQSGLVSFGYHSKTHKMLDTLSVEGLKNELFTETRYKYFAYPGGHYSDKVIDMLGNAGFQAAFSISPGLVKRDNNLLLINRNVILCDTPMWQLRVYTTKAIDWYRVITRLIKRKQ